LKTAGKIKEGSKRSITVSFTFGSSLGLLKYFYDSNLVFCQEKYQHPPPSNVMEDKYFNGDVGFGYKLKLLNVFIDKKQLLIYQQQS
jgi:hypothetical protein